MSIGTGIALIVIGAIATFALNIPITWIDLDLVGYILIGAGTIILVVGLILATRRRSATLTTRSGLDPVSGEQYTSRTETTDPPV